MSAPIPEPRADDDEDVRWALSTAESLWSRGDAAEALKWLRRAAESAADAGRDERSLEIAKVAADVAGRVAAELSKRNAPQTPPLQSTPSHTPAPPQAVARDGRASGPPPLPHRASAAPPPPHRSAPPPPRTSIVEPAASTVPAPRVGDRSSAVPLGRASTPPPVGRSSMPPSMPERASSTPRGGASAASNTGASPRNPKTLASEMRIEDAERALRGADSLRKPTPVIVRDAIVPGRETRIAATMHAVSAGETNDAVHSTSHASTTSSATPTKSRSRTRTNAGGRRSTTSQPRESRSSRPDATPSSSRNVPDATPTVPGASVSSMRATVVMPPKLPEELTVERDFLSTLGPAVLAAAMDDLDEQTNVISTRGGLQLGSTRSGEVEGERTSSSVPIAQLRAHRVALALDPERGIQLLPLGMEEDPPPGLVAALIVPADAAASHMIDEMLEAAARAPRGTKNGLKR